MRKLLFMLLSLGVTSEGFSAGFYLKEQSIVAQGQAFAGVAAQSGLASSTYFNPAGLGGMEHDTLEGGVHLILPDQRVRDSGSVTAAPLGNTNKSEQVPLSETAVPNLYYATPIDSETVVGVGISAPFGTDNRYDANFFGRFEHISGSLKAVDYTVALGHQLTDRIRLGGALYLQQLDVEQVKATAATQTATLEGDAEDMGFSLGAQYQTGTTTFGLSYRSGTEQDISGTNLISGTGTIPTGTYLAKTTMKLPAVTSVGIEHGINERTILYLGATRYGWSVYDAITVETAGIGASTTQNRYSDTTNFSIGVGHQYRADLQLRAGLMIDPTPTNNRDRSFSTPDSDRAWITLGASKTVNDTTVVDIAFSHIRVDDAAINKVSGSGYAVSADIAANHNIISVGFRKTF
ncbi:MAG: hypothetical protein HN842_03285 [Gammaproteobacteria bacterium]|jgi:long-chain fatty acid transport protein|nr:hypothetical protein [Gammaproteobacteria bacterium]MBT7307210.1 hypothetical protein [Gammaproteobacteria bacterium]